MQYLLKKIKSVFAKEKGYSLIELMIAIGVFATVISMTSGAFVVTLRGYRKTFTSQNMSDNVRYVMEIITKEIRMGSNFVISSGGGCATDSRISFESSMPNRVAAGNIDLEFCLDAVSGQIEFNDDISKEPITSSDIIVTDLRFLEHPGSQKRITIILQAESKGVADDIKTSMKVQTTISPRTL